MEPATHSERPALYRVQAGTKLTGRTVVIRGIDGHGEITGDPTALLATAKPTTPVWVETTEGHEQANVLVRNLERTFRTGQERELGREFTPDEAAAHERAWEAQYARITEERARQDITTGIERIVKQLETAISDITRELAYDQTDPARKVERVEHTVLWLLPNLGLDDLTRHAIAWTSASRDLTRLEAAGAADALPPVDPPA
jgi:hypothetical protein